MSTMPNACSNIFVGHQKGLFQGHLNPTSLDDAQVLCAKQAVARKARAAFQKADARLKQLQAQELDFL